MKGSRYTEEQIAFALRQIESGVSAAEVCRKMGVTEKTLYTWKKKFAGLGVGNSGGSGSSKRRTANSNSLWRT